ncbi:MAG: hypothetical protein AB1750_08580 [Chloroflexota bacterium]
MDDLKEYRNQIISAEQKAQEDFDKTVLSLSGGALGVSFAFVKDIVGESPICISFLIVSWVSWALSSTSVLISYYMSHKALRHAIKQIDTNKIRQEQPGGVYDKFTGFLNMLGLILFLVGLLAMIWFVKTNLES